MSNTLSEKWIKASIVGTIWAASEIVLGSFLHNLRVPFSGNILTGIGMIILISISYIWTEKGLFWRAGLICALMKTMSPSAVIFGPMIAIFSEALLLELSVRLLGRTLAGYLTGAMLAMSWNLFQKIASYIIYYGANIIEVYNNLLKLAQQQLNTETDIVWMPIIILLFIFALFGLFTGVIGIVVGRKMLKQPDSGFTLTDKKSVNELPYSSGSRFNYSIGWLFINVALIICSFIILSFASWIVWSLMITGIIIIWSLRYKRALRQISKPKFWIFFVFITLITAFALTQAQTSQNSWQQGLLTGIQMNFRAALIIAGFSVLGTELYNPVIWHFFQKSSFRNLPLALELSVKSLPLFIASIPDFRSLIRNPVSIFYKVISQADRRLNEIKNTDGPGKKIYIITGSVGEGKTTYVKKMIDILKKNNIHVGGILSERIITDSRTTGYDLVNIETGEKEAFLREDDECGSETIGKFTICPKGLSIGINILDSLAFKKNTVIIIDEVGLLELRNRGWYDSLNQLLYKSDNHILITARNKFVDDIKKKWDLKEPLIIEIDEAGFQDTGLSLIKSINSQAGN